MEEELTTAPSRLSATVNDNQSSLSRLYHSLGAKIIIPYLLLTLTIAGIGAFLLTTFITDTLNERLTNQLIDAGRVVSERMVNYEEERLNTLRLVAGTQGVADNLIHDNADALETLVLPLILNNDADAVELLNMEGTEVYGWQRIPGAPLSDAITRSGSDFAHLADVQFVLNGQTDEFGDKSVFLSETPEGHILFTIGPVFDADGRQVGAALVGSYLRFMTIDLTENAVARVTFYDKNGVVIDTTLGSATELSSSLAENPEELALVREQLQLSPERVQVVRAKAQTEVPIADVTLLSQEYSLAYGLWRLRDQTFGLFSVALPTNFLPTIQNTGRNGFFVLFTLATLFVLTVGFTITRRITNPLGQLIHTATAVGEGDLEQRTGIHSPDEIGQLATSFDLMTTRLSQRTDQLMRRSTELETILNSIGDGVILLDTTDNIVTANTAAQRLLSDLSYDFFASGPFRELPEEGDESTTIAPGDTAGADAQPLHRQYQIGNRTLTTLASQVETDEGELLGSVIILRDITREVEAENLKDAFITNISHELRTPLTVIKVYADLLQKAGNGTLSDRQSQFIHNIDRSSRQLENHISQLITISEIQAGSLQTNRKRQDFRVLVEKAVKNWRNQMESKGIQLSVNMPDAPLFISAEKSQLGWAVESLLSNAHNYTPANGEVMVTVRAEQRNARLEVKDSGIGIAAADQAQLFNRFFRAKNSLNFETRGVGLGLFIARSVVEKHQGRIEVSSELGKGSVFTITLPLAEP